MIHPQFEKKYIMVTPTAVGTAATTSGTVDTLGFDTLCIDVGAVTAAATTDKLVQATISEGAAATGAFTTWTGSAATTFAAGDTSNPQIYQQFIVDLRGRKRYIKIALEAGGATNTYWALATLGRAEIGASTTTLAGVATRNVC